MVFKLNDRHLGFKTDEIEVSDMAVESGSNVGINKSEGVKVILTLKIQIKLEKTFIFHRTYSLNFDTILLNPYFSCFKRYIFQYFTYINFKFINLSKIKTF
jgi:hypothetical protein